MIYVISGTNRPGSRTRQVSEIVLQKVKKYEPKAEVLDLATLPFGELNGTQYGGRNLSQVMADAVKKVDTSDGIVVVTPEYNGGPPGVLKYFIDHWTYPRSFEHRPVAFVGLGGRWGGLRPVEHLQQIFNYRNAFMFPERVFISNVESQLKDGVIADAMVNDLLDKQANGFVRYIAGLKAQNLWQGSP